MSSIRPAITTIKVANSSSLRLEYGFIGVAVDIAAEEAIICIVDIGAVDVFVEAVQADRNVSRMAVITVVAIVAFRIMFLHPSRHSITFVKGDGFSKGWKGYFL